MSKAAPIRMELTSTVRPSKEERDRRAARKRATFGGGVNGGGHTPISEDAVGEDEDAEGEEE